MECPTCRVDIPAGLNVCTACGQWLPIICPACGNTSAGGAKFCASCGAKLAPHADLVGGLTPPAERRQLTVMFCDLVGSTALSARLDPEDLREVIGACQRACATEVDRFGGFVARYTGDGVLAYFGYPRAHEDDAERAIHSGLAVVDAVSKLSTRFEPAPSVRVGIATGLVVVGDLIGEGASREHAAMGETPNLAARLQALAAPNAVVISASTRRLTGGLFEYRDLGAAPLKGFDAPVPVWQVVSASDVGSRFEALHGAGLTPLVGRDEELEELLRQWRQVEEGQGRLVVLVGEPGLGKSRIASAFEERLAAEPHWSLRYFCSPRRQDSTLFPIISHLERAAGWGRDDSDEQKLTKLKTLLGRVPMEPEAIGLIAALLSLPVDGSDQLPELNPQRRKEKTLEALLGYLAGLAAQQPLFVLFEDVHWIDPTSLELLTLLIRRSPRYRVFVLVTGRPEFVVPWGESEQVTTIWLRHLNRGETAALVDRVASGKAIPAVVLEQVLARTDGVPLFVEELTKMVLESGLLREEDRRYALSGLVPSLAIPMTLRDTLRARLDRDPAAREVAQIGAVIGREFSYPLLDAVAGLPTGELRAALDELVRSELVFRRGTPPEAAYTFKHVLVRDAGYDALLRSRRQALHARIAATLEERFPEVVEQQPELLAQHCTQAGLTERAVAYWSQAGRRSIARSAMIEAVSQFRKGLELLPALPETPERDQQELDLQAGVGAAFIATQGQGAAQVEHAYARARELCRRMGDTPQLFQVLWGLWIYYGLQGDSQKTEELVRQLYAVAQRQRDHVLSVTAHAVHGMDLYGQGQLIPARARLDEAAALYDPEQQHRSFVLRFGYDEGLVGILFRSHALWYLGYPDQALEAIRGALSLVHTLSHPLTEANVLHFSAWLRVYRREAPPAQAQAEAQLALSEEQGYPFFVAHATVFRGWALVQQGHATQGIELMQQGLAGYRATGALAERSYLLSLLAESYGKAGKKAQGLRAMEEALTDQQHGWPLFEAELFRLKGELLLPPLGERDGVRPAALDEAEACFGHALEVARRQQAKSLELRAAIDLSRLWQQQRKRAPAQELLANVYGWFTEGFDTPDLQEAGALLGELTA